MHAGFPSPCVFSFPSFSIRWTRKIRMRYAAEGTSGGWMVFLAAHGGLSALPVVM